MSNKVIKDFTLGGKNIENQNWDDLVVCVHGRGIVKGFDEKREREKIITSMYMYVF